MKSAEISPSFENRIANPNADVKPNSAQGKGPQGPANIGNCRRFFASLERPSVVYRFRADLGRATARRTRDWKLGSLVVVAPSYWSYSSYTSYCRVAETATFITESVGGGGQKNVTLMTGAKDLNSAASNTKRIQ